MNIIQIIREEIENFWYHGTPDNREIKQTGSFQPKTANTDYISDPPQWFQLQQQMSDTREKEGTSDKYFELLHQAGNLQKNMRYKKPIYFTDNRSVASTYADDKRAFDYQNADPSILQATIDDSGKKLEISAHGASFRGIKPNLVRDALSKAGIPDDTIEKYFNMFSVHINHDKMSSETLGIIAQLLGFDIIDIFNVRDSYQGGDTPSTVRMVFDPNRIKIK